MNKTIVLAGDRNYTTQLETTIKSILYHNRDVKIYILNQDIMPDWFRKPRKIARMLGSDIIAFFVTRRYRLLPNPKLCLRDDA